MFMKKFYIDIDGVLLSTKILNHLNAELSL